MIEPMVVKDVSRTQLLIRLDDGLHEWLKREKTKSGRSMTWMVENALSQWRDRIEKGRKND